MDGDTQIRDHGERELSYSPAVNSACIGVAVEDGIVTLTGTVETYAEKLDALHAAERIRHVRAVVCELEVRLPGPHERTDADLARAAANVLAWDSSVPPERV